MAVLKSPRNSRNKNKWASQYALKSRTPSYLTQEFRHPKRAHQLQVFLRDSAHWVSPIDRDPARPVINPNDPVDGRPPVHIRYGKKSFDTSTIRPVIFRKYFHSKSTSERLFLMINNRNLF